MELKNKACTLFRLDQTSELFIYLEDGTELSDDKYLLSLKDQSLIIVSNAKPAPLGTYYTNYFKLLEYGNDLFYSGGLEDAMEKYMAAVQELQRFRAEQIIQFMQENNDEKLLLTWQFVSKLDKSKAHLSSFAEHPEWFNGIAANPTSIKFQI